MCLSQIEDTGFPQHRGFDTSTSLHPHPINEGVKGGEARKGGEIACEKALLETYTEFNPAQWSMLVDSVTVMDKKRMVWTLTSGMEIEG